MLLSFLPCLGCAVSVAEDSPPAAIERSFDFEHTGKIKGKVSWEGLVPAVPPLAGNLPINAEGGFERIIKRNPNAPSIDSKGGVTNAVVFLRGVDPKKSRPWHLRPLGVEQQDLQLRVLQGGAHARVGFVRVGDGICMISRDVHFNSLRARGAAFFSIPLTVQNWSSTKKLEKKGIVELTSGAGLVWMGAYLFVDDHPYYTRTNGDGTFALEHVPPGSYEMVCWMPNWNIARHELDPESSHPARITFLPPLERVRSVTVEVGGTATAEFTISAEHFRR